MIENNGSQQHIVCERCGDQLDDYHRTEFWSMLADAKERQWTFEQDDRGDWEHYCPTCRPRESGLQRAKRLLGL
jgi:Fe2+ or Zn2+ uptake regulation protein